MFSIAANITTFLARNKESSSITVSSFLTTLRRWSEGGAIISVSSLEALMKSASEDAGFAAEHIATIVQFAAQQSGRWTVCWLSSPAAEPDDVAKRKAQQWHGVWETYIDTLVSMVNDDEMSLRQRLDKYRHNYRASVALQSALDRAANDTERAAIVERSRELVGLSEAGQNEAFHALSTATFYPARSVGRKTHGMVLIASWATIA